MASLAEIEKAEHGLVDALSKLRAAKANVLRGTDTLRKSGSDPAMIDIGGRAYSRQSDGTYRPLGTDPTERVYISGTGGGRVAQETEERAIKMIRRTAVVGHVLPRAVR
jgi:hypothetical protein